MLDGTTPGPWSAEYDAMSTLYITQANGPHEDIATDLDATDANARLIAAAPDLAAMVASEPERIAAAVAAESARIYHAAAAALAAYLAADDALLDAIGRGQVRDEYHPLISTRDARLESLRGVLAPEVAK